MISIGGQGSGALFAMPLASWELSREKAVYQSNSSRTDSFRCDLLFCITLGSCLPNGLGYPVQLILDDFMDRTHNPVPMGRISIGNRA